MKTPQPLQKNGLTSIVQQILDDNERGVLVLSCATGSRRFTIVPPWITTFASDCPDDDLATFLHRNQLITNDEYAVLASRAHQGSDVEKLIISSEIVEKTALLRHNHARALAALLDCSIWTSGQCEFLPLSSGTSPAPSLQLPLRHVLLELLRRQPSPSESEILSQLGGEDPHLYSTAASQSLLAEVSLTPQESFVLSRVTSTITFRQLLKLVPFPHADLLRILGSLTGVGLVSSAELDSLRRAAPTDVSDSASLQSNLPSTPGTLGTEELLEKQRLRAEALLSQLQDASPFEVLGLAPSATMADIKAAYHRLAKEFHPDRFFGEVGGAEPAPSVRALFEKIRDTYELLKNEGARSQQIAKLRTGKGDTTSATGPPVEEIEKLARASHNRGVQNYQDRDFFAAVQHFREAVRIQPQVAKYHHSLARALMRNPRWRREAEEQFQKAIELDEFNADYRVSLGLLYMEAGMPRKAEAQFRDALAWDSENRAAQRELQKLLATAYRGSWVDKLLRRKKP